MSLATRPKPTVSHKKRRAQHHRHSKNYLRPYWPYLPMLAVIGGGIVVNKLWSAGVLPGIGSTSTLSPSLATAEPLTRIQVLTGSQATGILDAVIIISGVACAVFVFRHWRRLNRLITKSEALVYEYAWLDIITVFIFTVGFVLTRPSGPLG